MDASSNPSYTLNGVSYKEALAKMNPYHLTYTDLNDDTTAYIRKTACTITYMSICLSCVLWQIVSATMLAWKSRKWIHFILLFQTLLCFLTILCSVLNPITSVDCVFVIRIYIKTL